MEQTNQALTKEDFVNLLDAALQPIYQRLDAIEIRLDAIEIRLDAVDIRLNHIEEDIAEVKSHIRRIDKNVAIIASEGGYGYNPEQKIVIQKERKVG